MTPSYKERRAIRRTILTRSFRRRVKSSRRKRARTPPTRPSRRRTPRRSPPPKRQTPPRIRSRPNRRRRIIRPSSTARGTTRILNNFLSRQTLKTRMILLIRPSKPGLRILKTSTAPPSSPRTTPLKRTGTKSRGSCRISKRESKLTGICMCPIRIWNL